MNNLVLTLVIGAIAGWLAGQLQHGASFGAVGNIFIGVVGAVVGGYICKNLGISFGGGIVDQLVTATLGACLFLFLIKFARGETDEDEGS